MFNDYLELLLSYMTVEAGDIEPDMRIMDYCEDPFAFAELLVELEDRFGIEIPDELSNEIVTVAELWKYIKDTAE